MASVFDVANWFLSKEPMSPKKIQKLCYYYKAWGLALYGDDFIPESEFQAWVHGPVCPELYQRYKNFGWNEVPMYKGSLYPFSEHETDVLESVWLTYGEMTANALEVQTHKEQPWKNARMGLGEFDNCEKAISNIDMTNFYRAIYASGQGD